MVRKNNASGLPEYIGARAYMRFIMKKYIYKVTSIDTYVTTITVEAETQDEAEELVQKDLDACPIEERSGSFEDNDTQLDLI